MGEMCKGPNVELDKSPARTSQITARVAHPLYKLSVEIIPTCRNTIVRHREADKLSRNRQLRFPFEEWKEDADNTKELIHCGRQYAEGIARCLVEPNANTSAILGVDTEKLNETGRVAVELFPSGRKSLEAGAGWATTAQTQLRWYAALAKTANP